MIAVYYHNLIMWKKKKIKHFDMWLVSIMYDLKVYLVKNCGDFDQTTSKKASEWDI